GGRRRAPKPGGEPTAARHSKAPSRQPRPRCWVSRLAEPSSTASSRTRSSQARRRPLRRTPSWSPAPSGPWPCHGDEPAHTGTLKQAAQQVGGVAVGATCRRRLVGSAAYLSLVLRRGPCA